MNSTENTNQNEKIREKFYSSLKFSMRMYQLSGCAPFEFTDHGIKKSVCMYLFSGIQDAIVLAAFFYAREKGKLEGDEKDLSVHALFNTTVWSFCMIWVWVGAHITVAKWSTFLKTLLAVDQDFKKYGVEFEYRACKKNLIILAGQLALPHIAFILLEKNIDYFELIVVYAIPHSITMVTGHVYYEMVDLIKERFEELNKLLKILTYFDSMEVQTITNNMNTKSFKLLCRICCWHHNLVKSMSILNNTFGFRLVGLFTHCFVRLAMHVFLISRYFKTEMNLSHLSEYMIVFLCDAVTVSRICRNCEFTLGEARNSGLLIHQIKTLDPDIIDEIAMFSLQIMNEDIEFSAAGFFQINYSLLFSMIGAVTTYTIILIQLQMDGNQAGGISTQSSFNSIITTT